MKYLVAVLAAACAVLLGVVSYQAVPDKTAAPEHSYAYQRIDSFLAALHAHNYKKACEVLSWYSANQFVTDAQCAQILTFQFSGKMGYRMLGETVGRQGKYVIVAAEMVIDDTATKVNEVTFCQAQWAEGKSCAYAGVYTFGMALVASPHDVFAAVKHAPLHWYVNWIR